MPKYKVEVSFIFKGHFIIEADDSTEAKENIEKHVGLVLGRNIHHCLDGEKIDWDFAIHPEKKIGKIRKIVKVKKP